ncbi:MAG: bifunctional DNA-formamidopyrimidine glycosylase/DNA-(apurinic or apyrimidinic site) lyase [Patescibacteria group bacterium]
MPELPEVTTTVKGLQKVLLGLVITDVWSDLPVKDRVHESLKSSSSYASFKKQVGGQKVINVERRAKNILINLSGNKTILIHMKMTGHIIYGKYIYKKKENIWIPSPGERKELFDPFNKFLHVVFTLSDGKQVVLSDMRKFAKVVILPTDTAHQTIHLSGIGPEPLEKNFTFEKFKQRLLKRPSGNIKTVLMDQSVIAGIGNIYSDEMLWLSGIHPKSRSAKVPAMILKKLYAAMKDVLKKGIDFGGDSTSDYRDIDGKRGAFQSHHNVYRRTGEPCGKANCRGVILRKVINGRSAHFCSMHQKLFS